MGFVLLICQGFGEKQCKYIPMFLAPQMPRTMVSKRFWTSETKITVIIYFVFWTAPSKNTGPYAVFSVLQEVNIYIYIYSSPPAR